MTEHLPTTIARCGKELNVRDDAGRLVEVIACSLPPHSPTSHHRYEATPFEDLPVPANLLDAPGLVYLGTDGTQTILDRYDWSLDVGRLRGSREAAILNALMGHVVHQIEGKP